jgi:hypothetical protein
MAPQKLARLDRRAAELGRNRSGYVRSLIEEDLKTHPKPSKYVFASKDLVGCVSTGIKEGDNATVRKIVRDRVLARYAKNR